MYRIVFATFVWILFQPGVFAQAPSAEAMPSGANTCGKCHVLPAPTEESHELLPCMRHQDGNASAHPVSEAPDYFIIDKLVDIYTPVVFPHKLHASMSDMGLGCSTCHHHSEEGKKIPKCEECHDRASNQDNLEKPGLKGAYHRQCLGCHREWSQDTQCSICHPKRDPNHPMELPKTPGDITGRLHPNVEIPDVRVYKNPGLDAEMAVVSFHHKDHVEKFGRKCAECHRKWDCTLCHKDKAATTEVAAKRRFEEAGFHEACSICHKDKVDNDCAFCHDGKERPAFSHERRTGFALRPYHEIKGCAACHKQRGVFTGLDRKCESCHTGDQWPPKKFDHTQIGLTLDETHAALECTDCHAKGLSEKRTCDACHDDKRESFPVPAEKPKEGEAVATPAAPAEPTAAPATPAVAAPPAAKVKEPAAAPPAAPSGT